MSKQYRVYGPNGFESAHRTAAAAISAAKRGARRGELYTVVKCSLAGYTCGGQVQEIWASIGKPVT